MKSVFSTLVVPAMTAELDDVYRQVCVLLRGPQYGHPVLPTAQTIHRLWERYGADPQRIAATIAGQAE